MFFFMAQLTRVRLVTLGRHIILFALPSSRSYVKVLRIYPGRFTWRCYYFQIWERCERYDWKVTRIVLDPIVEIFLSGRLTNYSCCKCGQYGQVATCLLWLGWSYGLKEKTGFSCLGNLLDCSFNFDIPDVHTVDGDSLSKATFRSVQVRWPEARTQGMSVKCCCNWINSAVDGDNHDCIVTPSAVSLEHRSSNPLAAQRRNPVFWWGGCIMGDVIAWVCVQDRAKHFAFNIMS